MGVIDRYGAEYPRPRLKRRASIMATIRRKEKAELAVVPDTPHCLPVIGPFRERGIIEKSSTHRYYTPIGIQVEILIQVRAAAQQKVLFLPHALRQMLRPDRMIRRAEVLRVIAEGEVIEDYPKDARGHCCLLFGFGDRVRPIHVVCAPKEDYLAIITAYLPDEDEWSSDFRKRVKK